MRRRPPCPRLPVNGPELAPILLRRYAARGHWRRARPIQVGPTYQGPGSSLHRLVQARLEGGLDPHHPGISEAKRWGTSASTGRCFSDSVDPEGGPCSWPRGGSPSSCLATQCGSLGLPSVRSAPVNPSAAPGPSGAALGFLADRYASAVVYACIEIFGSAAR
jgi:hypothetical protein